MLIQQGFYGVRLWEWVEGLAADLPAKPPKKHLLHKQVLLSK
jgi:hypothetical protein